MIMDITFSLNSRSVKCVRLSIMLITYFRVGFFLRVVCVDLVFRVSAPHAGHFDDGVVKVFVVGAALYVEVVETTPSAHLGNLQLDLHFTSTSREPEKTITYPLSVESSSPFTL